MDLREIDSGVDPAVHWYYQSKLLPVLRFVRSVLREQDGSIDVVDFGAGSGFFGRQVLERFPDRVRRVVLVDLHYTEEELAASEGQRVELARSLPPDLERPVLLMMDLLEHVPDDRALLSEVRPGLGGARFLITVPAFQSLWSNHDVYLGHFRRYAKGSLAELLAASGFEVARQHFLFGAIFPLVWLLRRFRRPRAESPPERSDMRPLPWLLNALLHAWHRVEMALAPLNRLAGVTCLAEGRVTSVR